MLLEIRLAFTLYLMVDQYRIKVLISKIETTISFNVVLYNNVCVCVSGLRSVLPISLLA